MEKLIVALVNFSSLNFSHWQKSILKEKPEDMYMKEKPEDMYTITPIQQPDRGYRIHVFHRLYKSIP